MVCVSCGSSVRERICPGCLESFRPVSNARLGSLLVASGTAHEAVARKLVHLLKYQGIGAAADVLAPIMAEKVPSWATALVPVPRVWVRRAKYGVDPALELARRVGRLTGVSVRPRLMATPWWPRHAGSDRESRRPPRFWATSFSPPGSVLIDDVFTTGATLVAASDVAGIQNAVTATRADSRCNE